jgi:hypothetical protein
MNKILRPLGFAFFGLLSVSLFNGCTIGGAGWSMGYKFSGVNIPSDILTAQVVPFQNNAPQVQPTLANTLTEKLTDKILSQTRLKVTRNNGDVTFESVVVDYSTQPVSPQAGSAIVAAQTRLTVKIHVNYTNSKDSKSDFEQDFSRYIDYESSKSFSDIESSDEYGKMLDELITDIFNRAFVNW